MIDCIWAASWKSALWKQIYWLTSCSTQLILAYLQENDPMSQKFRAWIMTIYIILGHFGIFWWSFWTKNALTLNSVLGFFSGNLILIGFCISFFFCFVLFCFVFCFFVFVFVLFCLVFLFFVFVFLFLFCFSFLFSV